MIFVFLEKDLPAPIKANGKQPPINEASLSIDELVNKEPLTPRSGKKNDDIIPIELEIKSVPEKQEEEEVEVPPVKKHMTIDTPYDPILDLRDYKYPKLELLEAHGVRRSSRTLPNWKPTRTRSSARLKIMI
jgi:hypothetical protein